MQRFRQLRHPGPLICLAFVVALCVRGPSALADDATHDLNAKVTAPTRIDWVFALSNQSRPSPRRLAQGIRLGGANLRTLRSQKPEERRAAGARPLHLAGRTGCRAGSLRHVCEDHQLLLASPHAAGNSTDTRKRVRIVLDVLDELRRKYRIDPDRTYVGGFSGGGRIACAVGFSLPEYFGGVIPVCAAGDLREEAVAAASGDRPAERGPSDGRIRLQPGRGRTVPRADARGGRVRSKVWVAPATGHAIPPRLISKKQSVGSTPGWNRAAKLAKEFPASRAADEPLSARR